MLHKRRSNVIVALCTSSALITFAAYQRDRPVTLPIDAFFVAAAMICLAPVLYGLLSCKLRRSKSPVS
jgi:hypothetical protein